MCQYYALLWKKTAVPLLHSHFKMLNLVMFLKYECIRTLGVTVEHMNALILCREKIPHLFKWNWTFYPFIISSFKICINTLSTTHAHSFYTHTPPPEDQRITFHSLLSNLYIFDICTTQNDILLRLPGLWHSRAANNGEFIKNTMSL